MKKILAIFLSVLLICAAMPFAFATAAEDPTIVVSDVEGKAGETVQVTVSMKNNPGIVSTKVEVGYDASVLEFVGAEDGDFNVKGYSYSDDSRNPFIINWCWANGDNETTELLATLTFKIKDDAAAGTYPLTLTYDNEGDIYDVNFDTVIFDAAEGSVTVIGVADKIVENEVEVASGIFAFANAGSNPVTRLDRSKACFVKDALTVDSTGGTGKVPAGIVVDVYDGEVYVDVTPAALAAAK